MCEFCTKHGEGKKWYQVMENYSQELLADPNRRKYLERFVKNIRSHTDSNINKLEWSKRRLPLAYGFIKKIATINMKYYHYGNEYHV